MSEVTSPIILDSTGQDIADALTDVADAINAGNATAAMLAYVENGNTATQSYAKGTYICWQSLLYTADTAINAGDAFYSTGVNKNLTAVGGGGLNRILDQLGQLGKLVTNGSAEMDNYAVFLVILTDPWVQGAARISCVYVKGTEVFMPYITYTGAQNQLYYAAYRINYNSQTRSIQIISALASNGSTVIPSISQIFGLV